VSGFGVIVRRSGTIDPGEVNRLESDLSYRGPDGVTSVVRDGCALVHARFVTTPEARREDQPLRHIDRDWWLVTDARIDNRDELRRTLGSRARHPLDTDADFIMAAYERWGPNLSSHLVGDFAFALWNGEARELLVVRDHLGIRPVHWMETPDGLVAASTLRAVRSQTDRQCSIDTHHVAQFITDRRFSNTDTFWRGIHRLAPACQLQWRPGTSPTIRSYWEPEPRVDRVAFGDAVDGIRELFEQAMRSQLRAVGTVGVQISGGYDSTTVLSSAVELAGGADIVALTLAFDEPEADESAYVGAAARHAGVDPIVIDALRVPFVGTGSDVHLSGASFRAFDTHWYDALAHALRDREGRVILTGHGGDALLHGGTMAHVDLIRRARPLQASRQSPTPGGTIERARQTALALRSAASLGADRSALAARLGVNRYLDKRRTRIRAAEISVLSAQLRTSVDHHFPVTSAGGPWGYSSNQRLRWYREPFMAYIAEAWDHLAAVQHVEQRNPFYDIRLVEFGLGLSPAIIRPHGRYRGLHRTAFSEYLPIEIAVRQSKADFSRPIAEAAARSPEGAGFEDHRIRITHWFDPTEAVLGWNDLLTFSSGDGPLTTRVWPAMGCLRACTWASVAS
jgi:asparagine synthase (glutamine-hydrolysing)